MCGISYHVVANHRSYVAEQVSIKMELPNPSIDKMCSVVDYLLASAVLHCDFHELFEDRIVAVVPISQLVEIWRSVCRKLRHTKQ